MKYIFADTNNWKFCALQTKKDNDPETLKDLKEILMNNEGVKLLLPEVIKWEYYRVVEESLVDKINKKLGELKKNMNKELKFPEHLKEPIIDKIEEIKDERKKSKETAVKIFEEITELDSTVSIPLTSNVQLNSEKRRIKKEKPSNGTHKKDQDCYIIESLISYLDKIDDSEKEQSQLIFCANDTDFLEKENDDDDEFSLIHPEVKKDLQIETAYYRLLPDMINKEFNMEVNKEEAENIKQLDEASKRREKQYNKMMKYIMNDLDKLPTVYAERMEDIMENAKKRNLLVHNWQLKEEDLKQAFQNIERKNDELGIVFQRAKQMVEKEMENGEENNDM